ncbi:hypothetical protein JOD64_005561 [Micromonospora luteifusca]|uniref:Peptidoglycan binding-like domain-containing protein n=1 Tax=Micromonospora luteifusca TaxID=709860 RepID=A0ABS2M1L9_9ACTN|nr:neuraminidase-like domain-containing protein [Micromonospora luteifusca]MBM7494339.1 hypothetical protein [Micromonospora luteifusca]
MSLYGKNLRLGARGDDVVELHQLLDSAGHPAPPDEVRGHIFERGTREVVTEFQRRRDIEASGVVDDRTVAALEGRDPPPARSRRVVRGQVMYRRGLAISDVHLTALHRGLRDDVPLGSAVTDERGEFVIEYDPADIGRDRVDLQVRAFASEEEARSGTAESSLAQSRIFYAAQPIEKVRIRVNGGPETRWTEYQQAVTELDGHLDGLSIADLDEKEGIHDLSLLAGKTNQPMRRLADLVVAHRLSETTGVAAEALYGLVRRGMATDLASLASQSDDRLQAAMQSASDRGLVPARTVEDVASVASDIRAAAIKVLVESPDAMGGLLHSLDGRTARTAYVEKLVQHDAVWTDPGGDGELPQLWETVAADPLLTEQVPRLQLNMQLAALTGEHAPLVDTLARRLDGVKALSAYSVDDFESLISELPDNDRVPPEIDAAVVAALPHGTPAEEIEKAKIRTYATTLRAVVAETMPTEVLANTLLADDAVTDDARTFWRNVLRDDTTFDLRTGIDPAQLDERLFDDVADRAALVNEVATVKRLFNVTKDSAHMKVLRDAGLDSATAIARLGASTFIGRYGEALGGPKQALDYVTRAVNISATSAALYSAFAPELNDTPMYVLPAYDYEGRANLETLFGSAGYCECGDCNSILSPAAYLAELLGWLADRHLPDGGTALDVLYRRRPDIGEIELSCANTNTTLPHLDLTLELLENLVAPIADFTLDATEAAELDARTISAALRDAFTAAGVPLAEDHACYVVTPDDHWFLTDHRVLWVLRRTSPTELTARFGSYQTAGAAVELAAEPEHRNAKAYDALRTAVYPVSAPLDLWTEEVRTYVGHLLDDPDAPTTYRRDLMVALASPAGDSYTDVDIACESLGVTVGQRTPITGRSATPWSDFGLAENGNPIAVYDAVAQAMATANLTWTQALRWVAQVLHRFDVDYPDLLGLLSSEFVDPDDTIRIQSADPKDPATCDVAKLVMVNFDAAAADRLRRFVRLRRALGWTSRECDDLITALRPELADVNDRIDDQLLIALSCAARLHQRLGVTPAELPALWATLRADRPDELYFKLFGNPEVMRPSDPAFAVAEDGAGAMEIALLARDPAQAVIAAHASAIMSALNLTAGELDTLTRKLTDGRLTLANLSALYRFSRLARALTMPVDELLALRGCAADVFPSGVAGPAATERFVDLVTDVRESGLTVPEVDYLLFHQATTPGQAMGLSEEEIAVRLGETRDALRDVAAGTELAGQVPAEALRRWMAQLRWPTTLVDDVLAVLDDTATFDVPLPAPPNDLVVPAALRSRVTATGGRLLVRGVLTTAQRDALLSAHADAAYQVAVHTAYDAPRRALSRTLKTWQWPPLRADLPALPADLVLAPQLRTRIHYDGPAGEIVSDGPLTTDEQARLAGLSVDPAWHTALDALAAAATAYAPATERRLFDVAAVNALLDTTGDDRIAAVAAGVATHLRAELSHRVIVSGCAEQLGVPIALVDDLLTHRLVSADDPARPALADFLAPSFATSHQDVPLTAASFEAQFRTYVRLAKLARLVTRLGWTTTELSWLADYGATVAPRPIPWQPAAQAPWWQPATLPVTPTPRDPVPLAALLRVLRLSRCAATLGRPVVSALLASARRPGVTLDDLTATIATAASRDNLRISAADLSALAKTTGLTVADFADETGPAAQLRVIGLVRRTGASAAQLAQFAAVECDERAARSAREVVKARYDDARWREVAAPLRDVMRRAQRDALLDYVLADPASAWPTLRTESELYRHLLQDSRTEPIVATSRIKQAISSVQLFVQSATMNLVAGIEVDDAVDPGWRDWAWMKNYRVWEANRKVFCFPENWMEPTLRDDKTPLFGELESALMRDDVTAELVDDAFTVYLERLDELARLEILGLYEVDATPGNPVTLYAVGRTRGLTPRYFWRTRIDNAEWTPWKAIDADISERQVLPVVWNGRLYVFWPIFADITPQQEPGDKPTLPAGRRYDISLAYTYFHRKKWQPKQVTEVSVQTQLVPVNDHPDTVKQKLVLRAVVGSPDLWIWPEWDNPAVNVSTVKPGYTPANPGDNSVYASVSGFHFTGRSRQVETYGQTIAGIFEPTGTVPVGMLFAQNGNNRLNLPATLDWRTEAMALGRSPSPFTLAYAHQDQFVSGARTFVYQDGLRCFVVDPSTGTDWHWDYLAKDKINPAVVGKLKAKYYLDVTPYLPEFVVHPDPVVDVAALHGTTDPLQLAKLTSTTDVAIRPRQALARRSLFQVGDQRQFVSKADKSMLKVSDYVSRDRIVAGLGAVLVSKQVRRYLFSTAFHPYVGDFQTDLAAGGVERLVTRAGQSRSAATFAATYKPERLISEPYPVEDVDFAPTGFFQQYNWELFFHAPVLIATRLSANRRFEEAQRWFHLVFDPTDTSKQQVPARFWRTKPLFDASVAGVVPQRLSDIINALAAGTADAGLLRQVATWRANPFNPYAIGRMRVVAFQKMVVMAYLDNLIAWGDQLFRQDTIESINYAANLYTLAGDILGERPKAIGQRVRPQIRTAVSLDPQLERLSNTMVAIEQRIGSTAPDTVVVDPDAPPLSWPSVTYFGVPRNDKLFGYWDTVADRQFKIRNSMTIEGVVRQLPLFEPPIDPALLVRARAAGLDIASVLSEVTAAPPTYRFHTLVTQALALADDVRNLGAALLAAMEKRDAEALAMLRATHETELADAIEEIREKQEAEARRQVEVLRAQRSTLVSRYQHYQRLLGVTTVTVPPEDAPIAPVAASASANIPSSEGVKLLSHDKAELGSLEESRDSQTAGAVAQGSGSILSVLPTFSFSAKPWGIGVGSSWGGSNLAAAANAIGAVFNANAASSGFDASKSSRLAQAVVREHDWVLQHNQAASEIMSTDRQRLAAELRLDAATKELTNHRIAMGQAHQVQEYLAGKYTNTELYDWMSAQLSALYFQSYQVAYDTAKGAERAMQRELGTGATQYVQFGYWDSTRKGLLAGERLHAAVTRMQADYLQRNHRTYELTKHVSLANVNPAALIELRETGTCTVTLPEALFDLDRPGDYCRRIKMVSLSLPCATGPYTGVNCAVTLLSSRVRTAATPVEPYRSSGVDDPRFTYVSPVESVVTSSGRDDSGMFQPDLRDERFLPFEGAGVVGTWRLELPAEYRQFDYHTISDAVLTIRYTALDGGPQLRDAAQADLRDALQSMEVSDGRSGLYRLLSGRHDYSDEWYRMYYPAGDAPTPSTFRATVGAQRFPVTYAASALAVERLAVVVRGLDYDTADDFTITVTRPDGRSDQQPVRIVDTDLGGLPVAVFEFDGGGVKIDDTTPWTIEFTALPGALGQQVQVGAQQVTRLKPDALDDVGLLFEYRF